jgi:hypothetical protein
MQKFHTKIIDPFTLAIGSGHLILIDLVTPEIYGKT